MLAKEWGCHRADFLERAIHELIEHGFLQFISVLDFNGICNLSRLLIRGKGHNVATAAIQLLGNT